MSAGWGTRSAGTGEVCPICRWPDEGAAVCGRCGWELIGGYVLGSATAADWLNLAARLADRQRDYDLRAAARAAGVAGSRDQALLARLAGLARGGPPRPEQIEEAVAQVDREDPPPTITSAGIVFALTRLVAGKTDAIAFVEIGPDAVSVQTMVVDALGVPARLVGDSLPWIAILPLLPSDTDLRYLRMAGGVGSGRGSVSRGAGGADVKPEETGPAALMAAVDDAIKPVLARLTAAASAAAAMGRAGRASDDPGSSPHGTPHRLGTVLVRRTHRWPLLDAAVERGRAVMRPVAEIIAAPDSGTLAEVVDSVAIRAPLRYGYDLVLVEVDRRTGAVRPRPHELFPAGATMLPGTPSVATVKVSPVLGYAAKQLALPIVARRGPVANFRDLLALKEQRPLITMAALDGTIEGPVQLRVRLTKPGWPRALAAPELLPSDAVPVGWPALIGELPERLSSATLSSVRSLDLVLLVELGGFREDAVAARVRLARGVIEAFRDAPAVRIAVMGYRDHFGKYRVDAIAVPGREREALVVGCGLSTTAGAQSMFRRPERWQAVPVGDDHAAPVEDALQLIADRLRGWRPDARHVLLVVGRRPPHPEKAGRFGDVMLPCPHRCSWQHALGRLRNEQAVECFVVLDRRPAPGYAEQAWQQFGAQGHFWSGSTTAQAVAQAVGLASQPGTRLRLAALVDAASPASYGEEAGP